jgi:predicted DNA-binding protein with PD1-like motif
MKARLLDNDEQKTFALVFDSGDEVMEGLMKVCREHRPRSARFTAIGAFQSATLAYFDWSTKKYQEIPISEQVEVLTLAGDIAWKDDGEPVVHAHVVVGLKDGTTRGGHLKKAIVRPTLELVLTEYPEYLARKHDPESGLALIRL